jgi:hypothetical protein
MHDTKQKPRSIAVLMQLLRQLDREQEPQTLRSARVVVLSTVAGQRRVKNSLAKIKA